MQQGAAAALQQGAGAALQHCFSALQHLTFGALQHLVFTGLQQLRASATPPIANTTPNAIAKPNKRFILISFDPKPNTKHVVTDLRHTHLPQQFCP